VAARRAVADDVAALEAQARVARQRDVGIVERGPALGGGDVLL
jgi:hypothetical protein